MATDKSLNIRQVKATEDLAASLEAINQRIEALQAALAEIKAALAGLSGRAQAGKLEQAARSTVSRK